MDSERDGNERTMTATDDVIDRLAGITAGSPVAAVRAARPEVVRAAQATYDALLAPADPAGVSLVERSLIALRVAALTPSAIAAAWYRERLARSGRGPGRRRGYRAGWG